jgi:hypothetical protein
VLYLDVNLGNDVQKRIVLNKGEDYKAVVKQFVTEFSLSEKKEAKLLKAIR